MICPHCGKELNTTTFVNPMQHVQGCAPQPLYLQVHAVANAQPLRIDAQAVINNGCNPYPIVTFITF